MTESISVELLLDRRVALLDVGGETGWSATLQSVRDEALVARGHEAHYQRVMRRVLRLCPRGMGGFTDLVLQVDGQVLPEQNEFGTLRSRLFDAARDQLAR